MKPGFKTTEFWLSVFAAVVGALLASGAFASGSWPIQVLGVVASVLSALGYTVVRGSVKKAEAEAPKLWPQPPAVGRDVSIVTQPPGPGAK